MADRLPRRREPVSPKMATDPGRGVGELGDEGQDPGQPMQPSAEPNGPPEQRSRPSPADRPEMKTDGVP